ADFIELKNILDRQIRDAVYKLERLGDEIKQRFKRDYRYKRWFQDWDAMTESTSVTKVGDKDSSSLWCDSEDSDAKL
ncbi:hypothetical protein BKA56DRAFT_506571, partial [Ilyonectria sp. MPI-CAGE-AT-0026]